MHRTTAVAVRAAAALAVLAGSACTNPLRFEERDYSPEARAERLRRVESLRLTPRPETDTGAAFVAGDIARTREAVDQARERFAGVERLPLTIEQARASTLAHNLGLEVALIEPTIAETSVSEEEGRFDAVFTLLGSWSEGDTPTSSTLSGSTTRSQALTPGVRIPLKTGGTAEIRLPISRFETDNQFSTLNPAITTDLEFSLSHNLLRGAGRRATTHAIRIAQWNQGIADVRARLEVVRQVAAADRAYWRLYAAIEALEVRYQQYQLATSQLDVADRLVRAGSVPDVEVTRAEAGVAERVEGIISAQNALLLAQRELKRVINLPGLDVDTETVLAPSTPPDPVRYIFDRDALTATALATRAELVEQEIQLAIAAANEALERNNALPLFALEYTYRVNGLGGTSGESFSVLNDNRFEDWSVGLRAEVPLGNEERRARVARAVLTRLQRSATKADIRQGIVKDVHDAIDSLESAWQRILAARQAVILETRTLSAERRQFDVGRTTSTDVLDADTRLAIARLREIDAIVDYQIAQVDLAFATGTLLGASRVDWAPIDPRGGPRDTRTIGPYDPASGILPEGWLRPVILEPPGPELEGPPPPEGTDAPDTQAPASVAGAPDPDTDVGAPAPTEPDVRIEHDKESP